MSKRRVKIVLLCEDSQHEVFIRRFLKGMGWNTREIRVEKSPSALGSAEQWVREKFPHELMAYRQRRQRAASALIAMIDADNKGVQERINEFGEACSSVQIAFRDDEEAVAIGVPKRNIETWIHFLDGDAVDENTLYPNFMMTRRGPFAGVKFSKGRVEDPEGIIEKCWLEIGVEAGELRIFLDQRSQNSESAQVTVWATA